MKDASIALAVGGCISTELDQRGKKRTIAGTTLPATPHTLEEHVCHRQQSFTTPDSSLPLRGAIDRQRCRVPERAGSCPAFLRVSPRKCPQTQEHSHGLPGQKAKEKPCSSQHFPHASRRQPSRPGTVGRCRVALCALLPPPAWLLLPGPAAAASPECVGIGLLLFLHALQ